MKATTLMVSKNSSISAYSRLYQFRKENKLSEKAIFILLYLIENDMLDEWVESKMIGDELGEKASANLFQAIEKIVGSKIGEKHTVREGKKFVQRIHVSASHELVEELVEILS